MEMIYTYKRQSGYINTQIVSLDINIYIYNWDSLRARLNSHYEAWSYKKRSTKKVAGY